MVWISSFVNVYLFVAILEFESKSFPGPWILKNIGLVRNEFIKLSWIKCDVFLKYGFVIFHVFEICGELMASISCEYLDLIWGKRCLHLSSMKSLSSQVEMYWSSSFNKRTLKSLCLK